MLKKNKHPNPSQKLLTQNPQKCLSTSFSESPVPERIILGETLFCTAGIWTSKACLESEVQVEENVTTWPSSLQPISQCFPRQTGISEVMVEALAFHQGPKLHKRVSNSSCWQCTCGEAAPHIPHEHTTEIPAPGKPGEASGAHRGTEAFTNAGIEFHKCHLNSISCSKEQAWVSLRGAGVFADTQLLPGPDVLFSVCPATPGWSCTGCSQPRRLWEPFAGHIVS